MKDLTRLFRLDDRVAIVTGGGSGIGKAIAVSFAQVGATVVIAEINGSYAESVAQEIQGFGGRSLVLPVDVTNEGDINKMVETTLKSFGRVDILVNNVGGMRVVKRCPIVRYTDDDWNKILTLNLNSTFFCCRAISRVMVSQKRGVIINIASAAGMQGCPGGVAYGVAKAGIINLTETLALELGRYHIRANCIVPSAINSGIQSPGMPSSEQRVKQQAIPLGRVAEPEDAAWAAIYLASDAADYVTGTSIILYGGPLNVRSGALNDFINSFPEL
jgi:3-oxoacyl-[acyl-carrier protein] reductase